MAEGTRTPDHRDHNPGLYQLSYRHRERKQDSSRTERRLSRLRRVSVGGKVAPDQGLHELLLRADELEPVALELFWPRADGAEGLALVHKPSHLLDEGLDGGEFDNGAGHDASDCPGRN